VIQKQAVDATFAMGHQADPAHCYKFHILQTNLQYTLFWDWGRWQIARIESQEGLSAGISRAEAYTFFKEFYRNILTRYQDISGKP
jgi:hypothetical protein